MSIVNQQDIDALISLDEGFALIYNQYGAPPNWSRPQNFTSLAKIIIEQQVSLASAEAHFNKLNNYLPAFTPTNILKLSDEEMRTCQISRQKSKYLRELSTAIVNKELDLVKLSKLSDADVRKQLTSIKGIGNWTADIYFMFCMQSKDILPLGDIAIVNTIKELYRVETKEEIAQLAEKWKPFRSLSAYFFWHYYLKKRGK